MRVAALLAAALPLLAIAQTYKWTDADGQIHFTQVPPRSGPYQTIGAPAAAPDASGETAEARKERLDRLENDRRNLRAEACRQALERVAFLGARTPSQLTMPDPRGGEMPMSDEEFARQRAEAQGRVKKNCDA